MSDGRRAREALIGSEVPRIFTPPLRELTPETSLGFSCIEFAEDVLGVELFPWQKWLLIHALELLEDGSLRFRTVVLIVARQNGKSLLTQVLAAWWLWVCQVSVLGTAQDLPTAEEVWRGVCNYGFETDEDEESPRTIRPELRAQIVRHDLRNGQLALGLRGGITYKVKAANRRAARGKTAPKVLMDELREQRTWEAWAAISKVIISKPDGQLWGISNAGDRTSVVLRRMRMLAHARLGDPDGIVEAAAGEPGALAAGAADGEDEMALGLFEWSAPPDAPVTDRSGWAQANPSCGHGTISERALAAAASTDPEHVFKAEVLCQWVDDTHKPGPFPAGAVGRATVAVDAAGRLASVIEEDQRVVACIDVSWRRSTGVVALCGQSSSFGGPAQVEIAARQQGTEWLVDWFCDPRAPWRAEWPIVVSRGSATWALLEDLRKAGLEVIEWRGDDLPVGTARFFQAVVARQVTWAPDPGLLLAARTAHTSAGGQGNLWLWDLKESPNDAAPLRAATGAWWGWSRAATASVPADPLPPMRVVTQKTHALLTQGF